MSWISEDAIGKIGHSWFNFDRGTVGNFWRFDL